MAATFFLPLDRFNRIRKELVKIYMIQFVTLMVLQVLGGQPLTHSQCQACGCTKPFFSKEADQFYILISWVIWSQNQVYDVTTVVLKLLSAQIRLILISSINNLELQEGKNTGNLLYKLQRASSNLPQPKLCKHPYQNYDCGTILKLLKFFFQSNCYSRGALALARWPSRQERQSK